MEILHDKSNSKNVDLRNYVSCERTWFFLNFLRAEKFHPTNFHEFFLHMKTNFSSKIEHDIHTHRKVNLMNKNVLFNKNCSTLHTFEALHTACRIAGIWHFPEQSARLIYIYVYIMIHDHTCHIMCKTLYSLFKHTIISRLPMKTVYWKTADVLWISAARWLTAGIAKFSSKKCHFY